MSSRVVSRANLPTLLSSERRGLSAEIPASIRSAIEALDRRVGSG